MPRTTKSVDSLVIDITANASTASQALGTLIRDIGMLANGLNAVNATPVINQLNQMKSAIKGMNANGLVQQMNRLNIVSQRYQQTSARINAQAKATGSSMRNLGDSLAATRDRLSRINDNLSIFTSKVNTAQKSTRSFASTVGLLYAKFFLLIRGFKGLVSAVKSSMDYIEVLNYFNSAMGQVAQSSKESWSEAGYESAQAYYDSFTERAKKVTADMTGFFPESNGSLTPTKTTSLGMNPQQLLQYQSLFAQMSNSMGVSSENAMKLSEVMVKLGADLASVKNEDFETAWKSLASGMVGMSRTVDKYGMNIRNANLQLKLNELGIEAQVSALSQADKALLRTIIMLESSTGAWADLAKTLNTPANQFRMLTNNIRLLGQMIGNLFLPVIAKVLPYLNAFVIVLQRIVMWIAKLLHIDLSDLLGQSKIDDNSEIGDILDDADDLGDSLDDDAESAKKLKKQLQGFDALNNLTSKDDSKTDLAGLEGLLDGAFNDAIEKYLDAWRKAFDSLENDAQALADKIEAFLKELAKPIATAWGQVGYQVLDAWKKAFSTIGELLAQIGKDFMAVWQQDATVGVLRTIFEIIADIGNIVDTLGQKFLDAWRNNETGKKIIEGIRNIIKEVVDNIHQMSQDTLEWAKNINFEPLLNKIREYVDSLRPVMDTLSGIISDFYREVLLKLAKWTLEKGLPDLIQVFIDFNEKVNWDKLRENLNRLWESVEKFGETLGEGFILFMERLTSAIADFINNYAEKFVNWFKLLHDNITAEDVANKLERIVKFIIGLKLALVGFKGATALAGFVDSLKGLKTLFPVFSKIKSLLVAPIIKLVEVFKMIKAVGLPMTLKSIVAGFTEFITGLSPLATTLATVISIIVEFKTYSNVFEGLTNGTKELKDNWGKLLLTFGSTAAIGAAAFGWVGVAVAAIVALAGALSGLQKGLVEVVEKNYGQALQKIFTNDGGTPIQEVVDQYTENISKINQGFDDINASSTQFASVEENIKGVVQEISKIKEEMDSGVISVEEGVAKLSEQFDNLLEITQEKFSLIQQSMNSAFGENGALAQGMAEAGYSGEKIIATVTGLNEGVIQRMTELKSAMADVDVDSDEWQNLYDEYMKLAGGVDEVTVAEQELEGALGSIQNADWSEFFKNGEADMARFKGTVSNVADAVESASTRIQDSSQTMSSYFSEEIATAQAAGNDKVVEDLKDYQKQTNEVFTNIQANVAQQGTDITDSMQTYLVEQAGAILEEAKNEYQNMDFKTRFSLQFEGISSAQDYAKKRLEEYRDNTITPFSQEIETQFEELGVYGAGWAEDAMNQIIDGLKFNRDTHVFDGLEESIATAINDTSGKALADSQVIGENIAKGAAIGIDAQSNNFGTSNENLAKTGQSKFKESNKIHSPSVVYEEYGRYIVEGLNNGITKSTIYAENAIKNLVNKMEVAFKNKLPSFTTIGKNMMVGLAQGISSGASSVTSACDRIARQVTSSFEKSWKIHSPSRVMDEMGGFLMQGLQNGIEDMYAPIENSLSQFSTDLVKAPEIQNALDFNDVGANVKSTNTQNVSSDNSETNALLKEQNSLLQALLEKDMGISEGALFKSVQRSATSYFKMTGSKAFT